MSAAGRGRAEAGRDPDTPRSPLPSSPRHLAPPRCPAPFPTWIPGRLANSLLREAGRGAGDSIQSDSSRRRFYTPALLGFYRRRAPHPASGGERCVLSQGAGAGMARPQAHTAPGAEFPKTPTPPLIPSAQNLSRHPLRPRHRLLLHRTLGPGKTCTGPEGTQPDRELELGWSGCHHRCASSHLPCKPGPGQDLSCSRSGLGRTRCLLPRHHPSPLPWARRGLILGFLRGGRQDHTHLPLTSKSSEI